MFDLNNLVDLCYTSTNKKEKEVISKTSYEDIIKEKSIASARILQGKSNAAYSYLKKSINTKNDVNDLAFIDLEMMLYSGID